MREADVFLPAGFTTTWSLYSSLCHAREPGKRKLYSLSCAVSAAPNQELPLSVDQRSVLADSRDVSFITGS